MRSGSCVDESGAINFVGLAFVILLVSCAQQDLAVRQRRHKCMTACWGGMVKCTSSGSKDSTACRVLTTNIAGLMTASVPALQ